jgi:hypothetical protein
MGSDLGPPNPLAASPPRSCSRVYEAVSQDDQMDLFTCNEDSREDIRRRTHGDLDAGDVRHKDVVNVVID